MMIERQDIFLWYIVQITDRSALSFQHSGHVHDPRLRAAFSVDMIFRIMLRLRSYVVCFPLLWMLLVLSMKIQRRDILPWNMVQSTDGSSLNFKHSGHVHEPRLRVTF